MLPCMVIINIIVKCMLCTTYQYSDRHMGMCVHDIVLVTRCVGSVEVILANEFHLRCTCICTSVLLKVCIIIILWILYLSKSQYLLSALILVL